MARYPLHLDTPNLGRLTFSAWRALPLGAAPLAGSALHQRARLNITYNGVMASNESGEVFDYTNGEAQWDFQTSFPLGAIALLPGGWLPSIVAGGHHLLTLDRHMTTALVAAGRSLQAAAPESLLALLTDVPVELNVLPHVLEGRMRSRPDAVAIEADVSEVYARLRAILPKATIVPLDPRDAINGAAGLWDDMCRAHASYMAFLTEAWPRLRPGPAQARVSTMSVLAAMAKRHQVGLLSLPFLAATVAVCTPQGNPAMRVLKAGGIASPQKVYNALADILHLQLVVVGNAQFPGRPSALLTKDRALADLWVGLGIREMAMEGTAHTCVVPMGEAGSLLADLPEEIIALFAGTAVARS